ncbi:permease [uncultured Friedmanniella sp.]|uniref:permease n=1 Tax=uncultured Friedmanniella sp. TaxID=335381 RepID=UPI0035CC7F4C
MALGLVLTLVALRAATSASHGLADALQDFLTLSISVVVESLPFVVLGVGLSAALQIWMPQSLFFALLPRRPLVRRAALSMLGVLLPVCECGNVPLARGLLVRGLSVADAMTFLLAAPILNPITIVVTYQAFGFSDGILFWRVVGGFAAANLVGFVFSRHQRPQELLTRQFQVTCQTHDHPAHEARPVQALRLFAAETSAMLPALFVGAAAAGAIQVFVPRNLLLLLGQNPLWSVVALIVLAFVIAICSTVDAFFVLSLGSTFTPGAVIAFLLFGPMIDIKMIALLRTTFTPRTLAVLTTIVTLFVAAVGLAVNYAR